MPVAVALTLAFFGLAMARSGWRVIMALERSKSIWVYAAIPVSAATVIWCFYAAYWMIELR